jgi:hypothetical protein
VACATEATPALLRSKSFDSGVQEIYNNDSKSKIKSSFINKICDSHSIFSTAKLKEIFNAKNEKKLQDNLIDFADKILKYAINIPRWKKELKKMFTSEYSDNLLSIDISAAQKKLQELSDKIKKFAEKSVLLAGDKQKKSANSVKEPPSYDEDETESKNETVEKESGDEISFHEPEVAATKDKSPETTTDKSPETTTDKSPETTTDKSPETTTDKSPETTTESVSASDSDTGPGSNQDSPSPSQESVDGSSTADDAAVGELKTAEAEESVSSAEESSDVAEITSLEASLKAIKASELQAISKENGIFEIVKAEIELYKKFKKDSDHDKVIEDVERKIKKAEDDFSTATSTEDIKSAADALRQAFECDKALSSIPIYKISPLTEDEQKSVMRFEFKKELEKISGEALIKENVDKFISLLSESKVKLDQLIEILEVLLADKLTGDQKKIVESAQKNMKSVQKLLDENANFASVVSALSKALTAFNKVSSISTTSTHVADAAFAREAFIALARAYADNIFGKLLLEISAYLDKAKSAHIELSSDYEATQRSAEEEKEKIHKEHGDRVSKLSQSTAEDSLKNNRLKRAENTRDQKLQKIDSDVKSKHNEAMTAHNHVILVGAAKSSVENTKKAINDADGVEKLFEISKKLIDDGKKLETEIEEELLDSGSTEFTKKIEGTFNVSLDANEVNDSFEKIKEASKNMEE